MKLTRTREFVVNMGNYESFRSSATVELEDPATLFDMTTARADQLLDEAIEKDLKEAANLTDVRNSFILTWNKEHYN